MLHAILVICCAIAVASDRWRTRAPPRIHVRGGDRVRAPATVPRELSLRLGMDASSRGAARYDSPMATDDIEARLLQLDPRARARLAARLLASLDSLSQAERDELWAEEALRRSTDLERETAIGRPAAEVFRSLTAKLG